MSQARLILASASPRRKALLDQLGVSCTCAPADIDESHWIDEKPSDYVQRMAQEKAQAIALLYPPLGCAVLAADTIVVICWDSSGQADRPCRCSPHAHGLSGQKTFCFDSSVSSDCRGHGVRVSRNPGGVSAFES